MTASKKSRISELDRIEDGLVRGIAAASDSELREDMLAIGDDPDKCVAEFDALLDRAKATSRKQRFQRAKSGVADWQARKRDVAAIDREAARQQFERVRARDPELASRMMMAARNGEGLSDADLERVFEALARLDGLEREDEGG